MWGKTAVRSMTLYELLGKMQPRARQDTFEFAEFLDVMEKRGFGPMLALPSFIACTPIGAIPGIPSLAGGTILLIALQILLGRRHPWLPQKVMQLNCDADQLRYIVEKVKPFAVRVDRFLVPRCFFMRQPVFRSLIALCCAGCGLVMIPLELIPFMGLIPAFAVLIMAIGMATDDGAVALFGVSLSLFGFILGFERLSVALS
ncbi:exopolysaccharide biosynthesis protein [Alteromonas sp. MmMcT2-2]|uniref:exopolysaccharide biosynthesis protein n=1 Tax=Alteromonas sp. MmMcT2-2 TaxID=2917732 RepID=UPI001207895C|nr:exopolysaccharide biosynthesis protein [Alteromonas sp. MmMcT2-2]MCG7642205.1 exopolysaccharide biosynthesis protein [Alteromonas sp. MmMcT2-2]RZP31440.1 MAG: exopolysaccharide biosynthesis protein [Alteromonas sp.]